MNINECLFHKLHLLLNTFHDPFMEWDQIYTIHGETLF